MERPATLPPPLEHGQHWLTGENPEGETNHTSGLSTIQGGHVKEMAISLMSRYLETFSSLSSCFFCVYMY